MRPMIREGGGSYLLCTPDKTIIEADSLGPNDGILVSSKDVEDALYEFCKSAIDDYAAEGNNKDVYTFSIYTDTARERLYYEFKYAEADYPFMYDSLPQRLQKWLRIYACVSMEHPHHLEIEQNYISRNSFSTPSSSLLPLM
ncbi:hypothetical protein [Paenibacillus chitinolyticus]|uniref:hypothetical protein n=1 Tax=Paenibacillus chitinolyticus TaxID=79263 RepID=UPI00365F3D2B